MPQIVIGGQTNPHDVRFTRGAEGGPLMAGQAAFVGEQGPELFVPRVAGQIIPSDLLAALRDSGPAVTQHNHVHVDGLVQARNTFEILDEMRRFTELGALGPLALRTNR